MDKEKNKLNHLAIIVDGNGRWATKRGLSRSRGHDAGLKRVEELVEYIATTDVKVVSLFLFSTENFKREKKEVDYLMYLLKTEFKKWTQKLAKKNFKIIFSGREEPLDSSCIAMEKQVMEKTKNNTGLIINVCLNYGGHAEITDACKKIVQKVKDGKLTLDMIDEKVVESELYQNLPPVDLMIRTGGDQRISNFLLWQLFYAELAFPKTLFPDFTKEQLQEIMNQFYEKDRRFGGNSNEDKNY